MKKPYQKSIQLAKRIPGAHSTTYRTWHHMRERCWKKNCKSYKNYGERGIKICNYWNKFENFYKDMGEKPVGKFLDRKNNDGNYCKENCRWATAKEQANNKRNNHFLTYQNETLTISQWADKIGLKQNTLFYRIKRGWTLQRALD